MNTTENVTEQKKIPVFSMNDLLILLGYGLFLGAVQNVLFYEKEIGINFPIFIAIFLSSFYFVSTPLNIKWNRNMYILSVCLFLLSIFQGIRASEMLVAFNTLSIVFITLLFLTITIKSRFEDVRMPDYLPGYIRFIFGPLRWLAYWIKDFTLSEVVVPKTTSKTAHILKWVLMTIPLIVIFTLLFSAADPTFKSFVTYISNLEIFNFFEFFGRLFNTSFFTLFFLGLSAFVLFSLRIYVKKDEIVAVIDEKKHIEIYVMLSFVSVLFLTFILLQLSYLFGGEQVVMSTTTTYSEYATKGFQELGVIAFIVFVLFWTIDHYLYGHRKSSDSMIFKGLSSFIIFLTLLMLFSAVSRLWMYENVYGFTETRFYGYVFIAILWASLLFFLYKLVRFIKEGHFIAGVLWLCGLGLLFCNVVSPESFIAKSNAWRVYEGSVRLDSSYIGGRSADAIDIMLKTYDSLTTPEEKKNMEWQFCRMYERINSAPSWQEFNFSKSHALDLLSKRINSFNCTPVRDITM